MYDVKNRDDIMQDRKWLTDRLTIGATDRPGTTEKLVEEILSAVQDGVQTLKNTRQGF